jgi:hypothetical protein
LDTLRNLYFFYFIVNTGGKKITKFFHALLH